jgi:glycosyltransferase involved in cell wall biosynthesis
VKGLDHLVEAFAALRLDPEAHLVLAGDGPIRNTLAIKVHRLGLEARVHLLGPRRDVCSLLKAADVFAFPSRAEGLPNALLEAMAAGCPIVATDVAGCRDLIEHERNGLLVPYGDSRALTDALDRLLNDSTLALQLGRRACETVTAHWQIGETYDGYESLYRSVLRDCP